MPRRIVLIGIGVLLTCKIGHGDEPSRLDTCPAVMLATPLAVPAGAPVVQGKNGLSLHVGAEAHAASVPGQLPTGPLSYASGFLVRDVAAGSALTPVELAPAALDGKIHQEGDLAGLGLHFRARYEAFGDQTDHLDR